MATISSFLTTTRNSLHEVKSIQLSPLLKAVMYCFAISSAIIFVLPHRLNFISLFPLYLIFLHNENCKTFGVYLSVGFLMLLWQACLCISFVPLYLLLGKYSVLLAYIPIFFTVAYYSQPGESVSKPMLGFQMIMWDTPLMLWMYSVSLLGGRVMQPFYSIITENVILGSMPLPGGHDIKAMKSIGVKYIVNLCREFNGLSEEYEANNIIQYQYPTPDALEPRFKDLVSAVHEMRMLVAKDPTVKIFVHCKAGRGRSSCVVLSYLISLGYSVEDAMCILKHHRPVIDSNITIYSVVKLFLMELAIVHNDFDELVKKVL